jgi:Ni/Co efflux regulator RcnB
MAQSRDLGNVGRGPYGRRAGGQEHHGGGPGSFRGPPPAAPQVGQTHGFRGGPGVGPQAAPQAQVAPAQAPRSEDRRGGQGFEHHGPGAAPGVQRGPDQRDFGRGDDFRGRPGFDRRPDYRRGPEPGYRPGYYARDHGWRGGARFRAPVYRYPAGWAYRQWAFGAFLPSVFLVSDYTLWDYWVYGLPAPPPGYHWIRVGPDALLVRYGDGYVLDAIYGIFY